MRKRNMTATRARARVDAPCSARARPPKPPMGRAPTRLIQGALSPGEEVTASKRRLDLRWQEMRLTVLINDENTKRMFLSGGRPTAQFASWPRASSSSGHTSGAGATCQSRTCKRPIDHGDSARRAESSTTTIIAAARTPLCRVASRLPAGTTVAGRGPVAALRARGWPKLASKSELASEGRPVLF